ncbi:hypothetical protein KR026_007454 [Drosophila bipectinata]|nr:hypothetical protein KR026_007454 [Drosophila bipectinata]
MRCLGLLLLLAYWPPTGWALSPAQDHTISGVSLGSSGSQPRLYLTVLELRILNFLLKIGMTDDFSFKVLVVLGRDKEAMRQVTTLMDDIGHEPEDTEAYKEKISKLKDLVMDLVNKS